MSFKYDLKSRVKLNESEEHGEIVGRAEYAYTENTYLIRYKAGDERQVETWWGESTLSDIPAEWLSPRGLTSNSSY